MKKQFKEVDVAHELANIFSLSPKQRHAFILAITSDSLDYAYMEISCEDPKLKGPESSWVRATKDAVFRVLCYLKKQGICRGKYEKIVLQTEVLPARIKLIQCYISEVVAGITELPMSNALFDEKVQQSSRAKKKTKAVASTDFPLKQRRNFTRTAMLLLITVFL